MLADGKKHKGKTEACYDAHVRGEHCKRRVHWLLSIGREGSACWLMAKNIRARPRPATMPTYAANTANDVCIGCFK